MKHLILGSEGQIGRNLTEYLTKNKENVIEFDIVRTNDEDLRIYNNPLLIKRIQDADIVYFLAFDIGGSEYMKKYQETYDFISNNIKIMNTTFDILKRYKKSFIFASSQMSNMFHSTYGALKAIGESITRSLGGIIVKFWNVYGYETNMEKSHVVTDFINMAKNEGQIRMKTSGKEERQFLYADDASECLYKIATLYNEIDRDKKLHITSFKWNKIIDIANIISQMFSKCPVIPNGRIDIIQRGIKNQPDEYILTLWKPKTDLKEGIAKVIKAMK